MTIRGSLAEAGLPDVFQLLALGQKTGCLSVARAGELGSIYFDHGRVAFATIVNRLDKLGERLVRAGEVDEADLRAALAEQAADPSQRLGEVLLRRGIVTREAITRHVRAQVEEAVYVLFTWREGTFAFEPGARPDDPGRVVSLDAGSLLLEGARRVDEWALLANTVPGPDALFAGLPALDAATGLPELHARLAPLLDGQRTVSRIAEELEAPELEVAQALALLVQKQLVQRVEAPLPSEAARSATRAMEHRNLGVAFYRTGLHEEAAREFRSVIELQPRDPVARLHLGLIALRAGRYEEAVAALRAATALSGAPAAAWHALALAYQRLGMADAAAAAWDEAARCAGADDPRVLVARAALLLQRGDAAGADALLGEARARRPDRVPVAPWFHYAALAALDVGDARRALGLLEEGAAEHPRAAVLLTNLAALTARLGNAETAARWAERAVAEDPTLAQAQKLLGDARYRAGRWDEAQEAYARAVRLAPMPGADAFLKLGNLRLKQGDREGAATAWTQALGADPGNEIARANLDALRRATAPAA